MGGMGQVYLAEHSTMKRRVAIKVLPPDRSKNEFARERFQREAKAAAAVEHPNIVRAFDLEMEGDVSFLVMEYIDGVTLHDLILRRGGIESGRAAHFIGQIASGLEAIHSYQLVHRDIKPANLLLDRAGVVRILDLGLVRSELDDDALTRGEGAKMLGTADYLAPEQAIECSKVDSRADLYSLGCTAYFLLTGQPPFPADKVSQKLIAHQTKAPQPIQELCPAIPEGFAQIIHRLLAKKPADRFQTARELLDALIPFVNPVPPKEEDFPTPGSANCVRSGISLNGWVSMNIVDRTGSQSSQSSSNGSAIRYHADTNPKIPAAVAEQQTKANSAQETLPIRPGLPLSVPATPVPVANQQNKAKGSHDAQVVELTLATQAHEEQSQPANQRGLSTAFKADRLFRDPYRKDFEGQKGLMNGWKLVVITALITFVLLVVLSRII